MIPVDYIEWRHCIEIECGLRLDEEFAVERLKTLSDFNHQETKKFVAIYGPEHLENICKWYKTFINECH